MLALDSKCIFDTVAAVHTVNDLRRAVINAIDSECDFEQAHLQQRVYDALTYVNEALMEIVRNERASRGLVA